LHLADLQVCSGSDVHNQSNAATSANAWTPQN
jgi:hypothetical protein